MKFSRRGLFAALAELVASRARPACIETRHEKYMRLRLLREKWANSGPEDGALWTIPTATEYEVMKAPWRFTSNEVTWSHGEVIDA